MCYIPWKAGRYGTEGTTTENCANLCQIGYYSLEGSEKCKSCPIGKYSENKGQSECAPCMNGFTLIYLFYKVKFLTYFWLIY